MSRLLLLGASTSAIEGPFLTLTSTVHVHIDSNSIPASWVYPPIEDVDELDVLIAHTGITITNSSVTGQAWTAMTSSATDVDGAYDGAKTNVLVIGETTNSVFNDGRTAAQTIGDFQAYLAGRLAAHPWQYVVMLGTLPRGGQSSDATNNGRLLTVDDTIRADLPTYGLDAFVYYRDIADFSGTGNTQAGFMTSGTTCLETVAPFIHPINSARQLIANRIARDLQRIPL